MPAVLKFCSLRNLEQDRDLNISRVRLVVAEVYQAAIRRCTRFAVALFNFGQ